MRIVCKFMPSKMCRKMLNYLELAMVSILLPFQLLYEPHWTSENNDTYLLRTNENTIIQIEYVKVQRRHTKTKSNKYKWYVYLNSPRIFLVSIVSRFIQQNRLFVNDKESVVQYCCWLLLVVLVFTVFVVGWVGIVLSLMYIRKCVLSGLCVWVVLLFTDRFT